MPYYILVSQFNIKSTSPAATVYLCQLSSKLQDELFKQCAPWETGSYNTYHINKQGWN